MFRPLLVRPLLADCYQILGIRRTAPEAEIKAAYRALAKVHHPDLNGGKNSARFLEIQTAYDTLIHRRHEHDAALHNPGQGPTTGPRWTSHSEEAWWSERPQTETEFEEIWRRMKNRKFWRTSEEETADEDEDSGEGGRRGRRRKESRRFSTESGNFSDPERKPGMLKVETEMKVGWSIGNFVRISDFNGRAAYVRKEGEKNFAVFLFFSKKYGDWKFHRRLKDEDTCLAFNEDGKKFPTNLRMPWIVHRKGHWEKMKMKIVGERSDEQKLREEISKWTVDELKSYLHESGRANDAAQCVEKKELIDLVLAMMTANSTADGATGPNVEIASRAHMGGAVELPNPSLSRKCRIHGNRVEAFKGTVEDVADWIMKNGNRLRYYGVFEDKKFQFGLIWAKNQEWQRVFVEQVRKPLRDPS